MGTPLEGNSKSKVENSDIKKKSILVVNADKKFEPQKTSSNLQPKRSILKPGKTFLADIKEVDKTSNMTSNHSVNVSQSSEGSINILDQIRQPKQKIIETRPSGSNVPSRVGTPGINIRKVGTQESNTVMSRNGSKGFKSLAVQFAEEPESSEDDVDEQEESALETINNRRDLMYKLKTKILKFEKDIKNDRFYDFKPYYSVKWSIPLHVVINAYNILAVVTIYIVA